MKINHLLISLFLVFLFANTITAQTGAVMVKSADNKKWGYVDLEGNTLIEPKFKGAHSFSDNGIAWVEIDKDPCYIDKSGKEIKTPQFENQKKNFHDGLVGLKKKKWGFMNRSGEMVFPFQFDKITEFKDGHATASIDGSYYVLSKDGTKKKYNGELRELKKFSEGLAVISTKNKKLGFVDADAKIAISPQFKSVGYFSNGYAWAKDGSGKAGYIDKSGDWIIKPKYDATKDFDSSTGLARVKLDGKWFYVDNSGATVNAPFKTTIYGDFHDGLSKGKVDGLVGFYDKSGNWPIKPQFEGVRDFSDGYAAAKKNGKWGVINTKGEWVVKAIYAGIKDPVVFK